MEIPEFCNICFKQNNITKISTEERMILNILISLTNYQGTITENIYLCLYCCEKLKNIKKFKTICARNFVHFRQTYQELKRKLEVDNDPDIKRKLQSFIDSKILKESDDFNDESNDSLREECKENEIETVMIKEEPTVNEDSIGYNQNLLQNSEELQNTRQNSQSENENNLNTFNLKQDNQEITTKKLQVNCVNDSTINLDTENNYSIKNMQQNIPIEEIFMKNDHEETRSHPYSPGNQNSDERTININGKIEENESRIVFIKEEHEDILHDQNLTNDKSYKLESTIDLGIDEGKTDNLNTALKNPPTCSICKKTFTRASSLATHVLVHTGERPHKCYLCKKTFRQPGYLNIHLRLHTGEKPHKCEICHKTFSKISNFYRHRRNHTENASKLKREKLTKKCGVCQREFSTRFSLLRHQRVHSGEKPYTCNTCGVSFSQSGTLLDHTRVHTGDMPFKCNMCTKSFRRSSDLSTHQKTHEKKLNICNTENKIQIEKEKPGRRCGICEKVFKFPSKLRAHERSHTGERPYKCSKCFKTFKRSSHLLRHQRTHRESEKLVWQYQKGTPKNHAAVSILHQS